MGIGMLIISLGKIPKKNKYKIKGPCWNNKAEYKALIVDLEILLELGETKVEIIGDSELAVK